MATITKRGSVWQAKVRRKGHPTYTSTHPTRAEAEIWARTVESQMARGHTETPTMVSANKLTLADALVRYRDEITPTKKGAAVERYRIARWLKHPLANRSLYSLRGPDFAEYRNQRLAAGAAPATVRQEMALASNVYTRCVREWGLDDLTNPLASVVMPKPGKGRERRLRPGEEAALLAAAAGIDPGLPRIIQWALETAMRRGEIAGLSRRLVSVEHRTATLLDTKNGSTRTVPLSSRAIAALPPGDYGGASDAPVFGATADWMTRKFTEACERAGISDLRLHDLRHEATSRLFELGVFNVIEIAAITGHKDLKMLARYTHLSARLLADRLG